MISIGLLILLAFVAVIAYKKQALTQIGAIGMFLFGSISVFAFTYKGLVLLGVFFITSTLVGRWPSKLDRQKHLKPKRNIRQVFANGYIPLIASIGYLFAPSPIWLGVFVGSIAEAASDTWASEIGSTSRAKPFHLVQFKSVATGLSGAVTMKGFAAAFCGSAAISLVAIIMWQKVVSDDLLLSILVFTIVGFIGNMIDTLLGGTVQAGYECLVCGSQTDERTHCQTQTSLQKGWPWMTNNMVNAVSTLSGGVFGGVAVFWL